MRVEVYYGEQPTTEARGGGYAYDSPWEDLELGELVEVPPTGVYSYSQTATVVRLESDYGGPVAVLRRRLGRKAGEPRPVKRIVGYDDKTIEAELVDAPDSETGRKVIAVRIRGARGAAKAEVLLSGYGGRELLNQLDGLPPEAD